MKKLMLMCAMALLAVTVTAQNQTSHVVQRGETLESIATKYNVTVTALKEANPDAVEMLYVGMKLDIPAIQYVQPVQDETVGSMEAPVRQPEVAVQDYSVPNDETNNKKATDNDEQESIPYYGLGYYSYDGGENYGLNFGAYNFNGFGLGMNLRSNLKFADHQNTYNSDILVNYSFGAYTNDDIKAMITVEAGPSIASRSVYDKDEGKIKDNQTFIDGFVGIKGTLVFKKVVLSAGYHIWAPKWKFGKREKADGFYAQFSIRF